MRKTFSILTLFVLSLTASAQTDSTAFMKRLCQLVGVSEVKPLEHTKYKEKYVLNFRQNVNGINADCGTFDQRIIIGYQGEDRPTVLVTEGYYADYALSPGYEEELTKLFDANLIFCEYRFFGPSTPVPTDWTYMTVDNSLHDYHNVRQVFGSVFTKKWISTGISKGGQTTMFYRATYPEDVDVSVSYVAPLNRAVEDGRHERFLLKEVGTHAERHAIKKAMQEFMKRKNRLMPMFDDYCAKHGYKFYAPTTDIYDYCVLEFPFALWQWGTPVSTIPEAGASNREWFNYLITTASPDYFAYPNKYMPFTVQAARELGYYGYSLKHIHKWSSLKDTKGYLQQLMLPDSLRSISFEPALYERTVKYLSESDPKHIFIYGEIDPWSASGVCTWLNCKNKNNMRIYVQPRGSHKARISNMPTNMKDEIMKRLSSWLE